MKNSTLINSKAYVRPKKIMTTVVIFLNIVLAIYLLINVFMILMDGIKIKIILNILIAIVIVRGISSNFKPKYASSLAQISIEPLQMQIAYKNVAAGNKFNYDEYVILNKDDIQNIEYSDKLLAFRFSGSFKKSTSNNSDKYYDINEWILYVEKDKTMEVTEIISSFTGKEIMYVDNQK